ncbi:hypothetical protein [Paraburkholderia sp. HD33-4]|uniref:hypothetical protein n=1 Tax=Paraburkholderia sp. HD33-4 TaxID=2883242 RepID=UPI001F247BE3|nr:hypothetical protein [Paraburkholderia sp. HD33-4]
MAVVTIDSTDTAAILADAGVELEQPTEKPQEAVEKPETKSADKGIAGDDDEDENGLTAEQRRDLTEKMQKTIGKKHRMQKEAEEFAAAQYNERKLAEERADRLEKELAAERAKSTSPETQKAPTKPLRENFANEYEYVDAMIQYGVDERLREKAAEDAEAAAKKAREEAVAAIGKRIDAARKAVPDFDDVVGAVDTEIPAAVGTYLEQSEMIAELSYYFAKNPEVLLSLAKLTPHQQLVKVGKIESTLSPFGSKQTENDQKSSKEASDGQAKPAPSAETDTSPSKPRVKAAPVITPLDGTGSAGIHKDSKDMNIREAIEDYSKRNKANLGMRKRH